ncbi:MAG: polymerase subunit delta, polymerase subunit delta protein [Candidatus Kaiserbacteria bacterium]|nr:polymerase subunit delta, polymerase subunit delta protein [Candidatus Kaiserbacteria bacterium]
MKLVGNVHLVAGTDTAIPHILRHLSEEGMTVENNPDIYIRTYGQFGVDEAREIRERAGSKALGERRVFLLSMPYMTNEAQNALLKVLEEPPADALFFFVLPSPETLLPTLRSRTQTLMIEHATAEGIVDSAKFLASSPTKRLDMLKPLLEKDEDEKRDMSGVIMFLSSLERMLGESPDKAGLDAVYRARRYIGDKGALIKPLLEQVALLVPVI